MRGILHHFVTSVGQGGVVLKDKMTRAEFFQTLVLYGVAALGGSLIASCGKKEEQPQTGGRPAGGQQTSRAADDPCADSSGLTELELKMRNETLKYVSKSPEPNKLCDNCKFWQPSESGQFCGGCELIKGPIHPKGYCTSWFEREA